MSSKERNIIIQCIRHAQAGNNIKGKTTSVDPGLTQSGISQANSLKPKIRTNVENASIVLVSPLTRTLHTAHLAVSSSLPAETIIVAYPELREHGPSHESIGSPREKIKEECEKKGFVLNWELVEDGWEVYQSAEWREGRSKRVRKELWRLGQELLKKDGGTWKGIRVRGNQKASGDIVIVVVTHGSFLMGLTAHDQKDAFHNAELRSYEFDGVSTKSSWHFPLIEFGTRIKGEAEKIKDSEGQSVGSWIGRFIDLVDPYKVD